MLVTLLGSTYSNGQRTLSVQTDVASTKTSNTEGNSDLGSITSASFEGVGDWSHVFMLAGNAPTLTIGLNAATTNQYLIDGLMYERPVALTFAGPSVGFWSVAGTWAYQLKNVPTLATLYDVTDPLHPIVRPLVAGRFEDGPTPHAFWLSNPADEAQPGIEIPSTTSSLDTLLPDLDEVYIVPRTLRDELTPLLALRYAQKHKASAVAIEDIYNAFSYGQIAPDAIRTFLRSTAKQHLSLKAVTLVGDGSDDPRNYLGKANPTLVPPFLADVDPWVHETACDVCYVQLDGDDALSDWLPDLAIGRLPVKNADELTALVNKMISYETAPTGTWNWRSLHISDNYLEIGRASCRERV